MRKWLGQSDRDCWSVLSAAGVAENMVARKRGEMMM